MSDRDDELLARYARDGSEQAFTELVARHVNLVYATARRLAGNPAHAEEITQMVFIILARKARSLRRGVVLPAWLYQTTRFTAANFMKGERRRQRREQEAYMQSTLNEPETVAWEQITPLLDEAMGRLSEADRSALVLRFFDGKTHQEVAEKLNLSESAAHKRVTRALEKLREMFSKRGVTVPAATIAALVAANAVQAAPAQVAASVAVGALGKAAGGIALPWVVAATLRHMLWLKLRVGVLTVIGLSLAGGAVVFSQQARSATRSAFTKAGGTHNAPSVIIRVGAATNAAPTTGAAAIKIKLEGTPGMAYEVSYVTNGASQTAKGVLPGEVSFQADGFQATITVPGPGEFGFKVYRGETFQASSGVARISGTRRYVVERTKGGGAMGIRTLPSK